MLTAFWVLGSVCNRRERCEHSEAVAILARLSTAAAVAAAQLTEQRRAWIASRQHERYACTSIEAQMFAWRLPSENTPTDLGKPRKLMEVNGRKYKQ
jgi:hypothetical protein